MMYKTIIFLSMMLVDSQTASVEHHTRQCMMFGACGGCSSVDLTPVMTKRDTLGSCCDSVNSCLVGIPISNADLPLIINTPGIYTVCENLTYTGATPAITVASSYVALNFGFNSIDASGSSAQVIDITGQTNVHIHNAIIVPNIDALRIDNSRSIHVHNSMIKLPADVGIVLNNVRAVTLEHCSFYGSNGNAAGFIFAPAHILVVGDSTDCIIQECQSYFPALGSYSVNTTGSGIITIKNCLSESPLTTSFSVQGIGSSNVYISDCIARGKNNGFDSGFNIATDFGGVNHSVVLECCSATNFQEGFALPDSGSLGALAPAVLKKCSAAGNGTGFVLATSGRDITLMDCIAIQSGFSGFSASARNIFLQDCVARENGIHGFDVQIDLQATLQHCVSSKNLADGFFLSAALGGAIVVKDSLATFNGNFGIDVVGPNVTIFDTRSAENSAGDSFGAATVITY